MTLNALPRLASFANNGRRYRITSLGQLSLNPAVRSHPTVRVWLHRIRKNCPELGNFADDGVYEPGASEFVDVGVGVWSDFKVGDVWRDGKLLVSPQYESKTYHNICPDPIFPRAIFANTSVPALDGRRGSPLIPFKNYPFAFDKRSSRVLVFRAIDNVCGQSVRLIVPCAEIARFFFFTSTAMTEALLTGERLTHHLYGIYNPRWTVWDSSTGNGCVGLRQRIRNSEAYLAGLIGLSSYARRCAERIYESLLQNLEEFGCASIDAYPPFQDVVSWRVRGKTMKTGGQLSFLVFSIETCGAEFPWNKLSYIRDNEQLVLRFDQEPSNLFEPTIVCVTTNRFTHLDLSKIQRIEKPEANAFRSAAFNYTCEFGSQFEMGPGSWLSDGLPPLESVSEETGKPVRSMAANLNSFLATLTKLQKLDNIQLKPLDNTNVDEKLGPGLLYMPGPHTWCFIDKSRELRRRVMVVKAIFRNWNFYLFEIERRPKTRSKEEHFAALILHDKKGKELDRGTIELVLKQCAEDRGVWHVADQRLKRKRMIHRSRSVDLFASRFYQYFLNKAGEPNEPIALTVPEAKAA